MTYAQYLQGFIGKSGWLSQNPHGWFEFTLATRPNTKDEIHLKGRMFEAEHTIAEVNDDYIVVSNKPVAHYSRLIPLSLFIFQYIEKG
jgi:hypothetical protein